MGTRARRPVWQARRPPHYRYDFFALGLDLNAGGVSGWASGVSRRPFSVSRRNQSLNASFCRLWRT